MALSVITAEGDIKELTFSRCRCFEQGIGAEEERFLSQVTGHLKNLQQSAGVEPGPGERGSLAIYGAGSLGKIILGHEPGIRSLVRWVIDDDPDQQGSSLFGIPVCAADELPGDVRLVFLCSRRWSSLQSMRSKLPAGVQTVDLNDIAEGAPEAVPRHAWIQKLDSIYPIEIPEIQFDAGMEMILLDLPGRYANEMPVGLAYVHNALEESGIRHQTVDAGMILYHRFHTRRILDGDRDMVTPSGYRVVANPWLAEYSDEWQEKEFLRYFHEEMDEIVGGVTAARPTVLGISLHQNNLAFAREVIERLRGTLPELVIIVGGMACSNHGVAWDVCPEADYICVGEADLTIGPLVERIIGGERPGDVAGVLSRYDSPQRVWLDTPVSADLDSLTPPRYPWADVRLYRTWNDDTVIPLVASRGCHWGRCRFCNEPYGFRCRSAASVVDEIAWFHDQGFSHFVFHDSDCNGDPEGLVKMCQEINRRGLKIRISGQMRVRKSGTPDFFRTLRQGGFDFIRFGVDGWSKNALKLQRKGYTKSMITNNLKSCTEAGIGVDVNCVVGVPGETEEDIDEAIEFMIENKPWYRKMAYLHSLMMFIGSEYWKNPDLYGIKVRTCDDAGDEPEGDNSFICRVPDHLWHSTEPHIDARTKLSRLRRVFNALWENGIAVSDYAIKHMEREQRSREKCSAVNADRDEAEGRAPVSDSAGDHEGDYYPFWQEGRTVGIALDQAFKVLECNESYSGRDAARVLGSHKGYHLVVHCDRVYGVPMTMQGVDVMKQEHRNMLGIFSAANPAQVIDVIDRIAQVTNQGLPDAIEQREEAPFVVEKDYKSFLIYASKGRLVGLHTTLNFADLPRLSEEQLVGCMQQRLIHSAPSLDLVISAIDQAAMSWEGPVRDSGPAQSC